MARTSETQDEKNKFIFFQTFYTQAMSIKNIECREHFFRTIAEYGLYEKTPDFSKYDPSGLGLLDGMFEPIKFLIDQNHQKYEQTCEARKEAGKKGGNKNFQKGKRNPYYSKKETTEKDNQMDIKDNQMDIKDNQMDIKDNQMDIKDNQMDIKDNPNNKNNNKNNNVSLYKANQLTIEEKKLKFRKEIDALSEKYDLESRNNFYCYWTESNKNGLLRFENEEFWDTEKRLFNWVNRENHKK